MNTLLRIKSRGKYQRQECRLDDLGPKSILPSRRQILIDDILVFGKELFELLLSDNITTEVQRKGLAVGII